MLKNVLLDQCPELQAIPRLPPGCCEGGPEDFHRMLLALEAFINITDSNIRPLPCAISPDHTPAFSLDDAVHPVICDGCGMRPLRGLRYKARDIESLHRFCPKCYTNKCNITDCNFTKSKRSYRRYSLSVYMSNYDLCQACFTRSGYDEKQFYPGIHQTVL